MGITAKANSLSRVNHQGSTLYLSVACRDSRRNSGGRDQALLQVRCSKCLG
jgi:hypothetical protein